MMEERGVTDKGREGDGEAGHNRPLQGRRK
jgi:hypothetical protein